MESVVHWFAENMPSFLTPEAAVFLISMVPILELRGGLLLATVLKIPMLQAVFACVIGNIIPIPFILLFIRQIFKWLKKTKLFCPLIEKLEKRERVTRSKNMSSGDLSCLWVYRSPVQVHGRERLSRLSLKWI